MDEDTGPSMYQNRDYANASQPEDPPHPNQNINPAIEDESDDNAGDDDLDWGLVREEGNG
ncbi:MAG: hypothetical protein MI674_07145 [Cytophagales bacterium]|nr:hypothetical protein [Cytophagales bacterium]